MTAQTPVIVRVRRSRGAAPIGLAGGGRRGAVGSSGPRPDSSGTIGRMADTWMPMDEDPRFDVPAPIGERETVLQYLRHYRITFAMKCEGLDAEQMARRSVPPSTMSMLGLLRHLARVEHHWFRRWIGGRMDLPRIYWSEDDGDLDFSGAVPDEAVVAEAWASWRAEVAHAEEVTAALPSFNTLVGPGDDQGEVRDVLVHLVEEYARHCGHADLLRECLDGRTGE
jgi:uncharacterized damage-inducible protein DinB